MYRQELRNGWEAIQVPANWTWWKSVEFPKLKYPSEKLNRKLNRKHITTWRKIKK